MEKELCQICHHRIAEHKFVRIVGGVETPYRICSHCKALMDNKYKELQAEAARKAVPPEKRVCPVCGSTEHPACGHAERASADESGVSSTAEKIRELNRKMQSVDEKIGHCETAKSRALTAGNAAGENGLQT